MFIDLERKWNVNGKLMTYHEMTSEDIQNWKLCRDKLDYLYGHNNDHRPKDDQRLALLWIYDMFELPLSQEEKKLLEWSRAEARMHREAYKQRKEEKNQRKRGLKYV
jgi:hypothetical protein